MLLLHIHLLAFLFIFLRGDLTNWLACLIVPLRYFSKGKVASFIRQARCFDLLFPWWDFRLMSFKLFKFGSEGCTQECPTSAISALFSQVVAALLWWGFPHIEIGLSLEGHLFLSWVLGAITCQEIPSRRDYLEASVFNNTKRSIS